MSTKLQEILSKYTAHTFGNSPKMYNEQQVLAISKDIILSFEQWRLFNEYDINHYNQKMHSTEELYDKFITQ